MRRILLCIITTSLIVSGLEAQGIERPFTLGVLFGPAFTVGKPESSDPDTSRFYSHLKTGFNASVTLTYRFKNSNFGIYGIGSWQRNSVDSKDFLKSSFSTNSDTASGVVNSNPLNFWKFLAGPDLKLPLGANGKCSIEFSIAAGALEANVPNFTINWYYNNGAEINYYYGGRLPLSFCYQVSSGLTYRFSPVFSLLINASYTHSEQGYNGSNFEYNGETHHYFYYYPVSSLNILAGVSYSL
jgi:hypothetical protein